MHIARDGTDDERNVYVKRKVFSAVWTLDITEFWVSKWPDWEKPVPPYQCRRKCSVLYALFVCVVPPASMLSFSPIRNLKFAGARYIDTTHMSTTTYLCCVYARYLVNIYICWLAIAGRSVCYKLGHSGWVCVLVMRLMPSSACSLLFSSL